MSAKGQKRTWALQQSHDCSEPKTDSQELLHVRKNHGQCGIGSKHASGAMTACRHHYCGVLCAVFFVCVFSVRQSPGKARRTLRASRARAVKAIQRENIEFAD